MSNIVNRPPSADMRKAGNSGLYVTHDSHASGNDIPVVVGESKEIRVEKNEYHICEELLNSNKVYSFKDKSNFQILESLHKKSCKFIEGKANAGDGIICKKAVLDKIKHNRKGTVKEILSNIQSEHGCNVFEQGGEVEYSFGGGIKNEGSGNKFILTALALPKYKDLTIEEAELLYSLFKDKEKLKKTSEGEYYAEVEITKKENDKLVRTHAGKLLDSVEKKGYGYEIQDDFTASDKLFEFIHAVRMYENEDLAKAAKNKKITKGKGDCFEVAVKLLNDNWFTNEIKFFGTPYLVHAEVTGQGKNKGVRFAHGWVEDDVFVYDKSNGLDITMPKGRYYMVGEVDWFNPKKYRRYTLQEAEDKMRETGIYGSWDIETKFEEGGQIEEDKVLEEERIISVPVEQFRASESVNDKVKQYLLLYPAEAMIIDYQKGKGTTASQRLSSELYNRKEEYGIAEIEVVEWWNEYIINYWDEHGSIIHTVNILQNN